MIQCKRACTISVGVYLGLAVMAILGAPRVEAQNPGWQRFDPPLLLADEGFRGVQWCTLMQDLPWKRDEDFTYPAACYVRKNEELEVFGQRAKYITYTFRNSAFYGVRIDFEGRDELLAAMEVCMAEYTPVGELVRRNEGRIRWRTKSTSIWAQLPDGEDGMGQLCLWGRDRKFPGDVKDPVYLASPPALNYTGKKYQSRHYVIYRTSDAVRIDGEINEKAWQDAEWTEPFEDHQAPYAPPPWKMTRVKMLYDERNLYFAARLQEENVWGALAVRDTIIYYDNDFEIFLDPTADAVDYFEFELNPLNTMFDMFHENDNNRGALADRRYDSPGSRHAVQVQGTLNYHYDRDEGWTVEVAIPFGDMKEWNPRMSLPVKRGDVWRVNFSRVQYLHVYHQPFPYLLPYSPCEDWVWNTVHSGSLHIPEMWGKVIFADMVAGSAKDEDLERGFEILEIPISSGEREEGMVHFPACDFVLGPDPTDPKHSPANSIRVPEFWMDRYETTVAEYAEFLNEGERDEFYSPRMAIPELCGIVREGPGRYRVVPGRENYPVVYTRQEWALEYARSKGKSLPSEGMWERAAVGLEGRPYPWGDEPIGPARANYDFHYGGSLPVGSLPGGATPEGIYDLIGNAREWTTSKIDPYPGGEEYEYHIAPWWYPGQKKFDRIWWVARGGGWSQQEGCMSPKYRNSLTVMDGGFRCVKVVD